MSVNPNPVTLTRHTIADEKSHDGAKGDLTLVLTSVQLACKSISAAVRRAGMTNLIGLAGDTNVQGEEQKKLDVLSNDIFINSLTWSEKVYLMVSEENDEPIVIDNPNANYALVFDPLDGSSNIDASISVGTIFGVYKRDKGTVEDVLRPGKHMVAAGYCMYGSSTVMVISTGSGVNGFTLDPEIGEFVLTHPDIKIKPAHTIYSCNEGNAMYWHDPVSKWIESKKFPGEGKKPWSLRYVGSMVADVHRTCLYGGVFLYPDDKKSPAGKLRLLYECFPMSFIVEQAGGRAVTTSGESMLDVQPEKIHERRPIVLGSKDDVQGFVDSLKK